jgi:hypothetical protein
MDRKNLPVMVLGVIGVVGVLVAVVLFATINANMFATYSLVTGEFEGGPSAVIALIPLAIGVLAGIGALILWGVNRAVERPTPATSHP